MQHRNDTDTRPADARRAYTAGRLVRFGDAAEVTLGGRGCQPDCSGKSDMPHALR